jgi:cell division protein FtsN
MLNNHSGERKKKPFIWIIAVVAVLLAGASVLYFRYLGPHPAPIVARGKIPPPPPAPPSVEPPAEPSMTMESAPPAGTGSAENAPGPPSQGDLESPPASSLDVVPQESTPETASEIAAPPQDAAAPDTGQAAGGVAALMDLSDSSDDKAAVPGPDADKPADAAGDELQVAAKETPDSLQPSDTTAPPPSDTPATEAEPAQTELSPGVPEAATPFTIQVGAYREKDNADRQVALLQEKGFDAYLYEKIDKNQRSWYFVRFGRFGDFGSADKALTAFKGQEHLDGAVVKAN